MLKKYLCFIFLMGMGCDQNPTEEEEETSTTATPTATTTENSAGTLNISVSKIPQITDPVAAFEASDSSEDSKVAAQFNTLTLDAPSLALNASTGLSIGTTSASLKSAFNAASNPSKMACQAVRWGIEFFSAASFGDTILCFLKAGFADSAILFDGGTHIASLTLPEDQNSQPDEDQNIKMKVKVDGDKNNLKGFQMWACQGGMQMVYTHTTIDSTGKVITKSKRRTPGEDNDAGCSGSTSGIEDIHLTSRLNAKGQYVGLKRLTMNGQKTCGTGSQLARNRQTVVRQSDKYFEFKEYQEEPLHNHTRRSMFFTELIDTNADLTNYAITKLALGDGAGIEANYNDNSAQGFNGDTLSIDAQATELSRVSSAQLPTTAPSGTLITFQGEEVWDCQGTVEETASADNAAGKSCNERFSLDMEGFSFCDEWPPPFN